MDKKQLTKLVSYFIMADGGAYISNDCTNARFIMNMKKENLDYVMWVKETFEEFTGTRLTDRPDYNTDGCKRSEQVRLESKNHPFITTIKERIYTDKYKGIDPHALKLLDWEAMAILFMCDGSLVEDSRGYWNLTLNMKRLSYGDQLLLKKAIKDILDCEFNVNRQTPYYYMRLRGKDLYKFCEGVKPYMKESFMYKIRVISPSLEGDEIVCSA